MPGTNCPKRKQRQLDEEESSDNAADSDVVIEIMLIQIRESVCVGGNK